MGQRTIERLRNDAGRSRADAAILGFLLVGIAVGGIWVSSKLGGFSGAEKSPKPTGTPPAAAGESPKPGGQDAAKFHKGKRTDVPNGFEAGRHNRHDVSQTADCKVKSFTFNAETGAVHAEVALSDGPQPEDMWTSVESSSFGGDEVTGWSDGGAVSFSAGKVGTARTVRLIINFPYNGHNATLPCAPQH